MASPQIVVFFLFDETTGAPLTGVVPTFDTRRDSDGTVVAAPTITEVGGGAYKFTPSFPTDKGLVFVINGGVGSSPRRQAMFLRPEDYNVDLITDLNDVAFGKWQVFDTGPDANRLVLYREDGVTVLKKFDLSDNLGAPAVNNPFKRDPV